MMGGSPTAADGILLYSPYGANGLGISLAAVEEAHSNTLIMGERAVSNNYWGWPYCGWGDGTGNGDNLLSTQQGLCPGFPNGLHNLHFWSYTPPTWSTSRGRGEAVRSLTYDIDFYVFQALSTRAGGEVVETP